jgi:hypothetical protein
MPSEQCLAPAALLSTRLRQGRCSIRGPVHPLGPRYFALGMAAMGHEERFPPTRLSAGCGFRKETITGMRRDGRDAPIPDLRETVAGLACKVFSGHSACGPTIRA